MRILLVEDNFVDRLAAEELLIEAFPGVQVEHLTTELGFRNWLANQTDQVNLVVLDVMLPWDYPKPNSPASNDNISAGEYGEAGLRCFQLLRDNPHFNKTAVILLTSKEMGKTIDGVFYLPKMDRCHLAEVAKSLMSVKEN
jgi:CheY-like chemotaxis protein